MPLFQQSVLNKYISDINQQALTAAWQSFRHHFHNPEKQENIRQAKEEQYQEGFLRELFVDVLGYTLNPQPGYDLTTEYKNEKDSKKADGAILKEGAVRAVIELKGTDTTDLSKVEAQAFGYLHNQKGCSYVITSNFEKLRFYIQDATEHLEFNLFTLTKEGFSLLYLCLHRSHLLADLPLQVKQQSLTQEDAITKILYADYSTFKKALYQNLLVLNPDFDKIELFKKTQKLLDRFLFILFAEDRLLLPPNFILKIVEEHKQVQMLRLQQSLYERFKIYFTDLLEGNKDQDIFAYNGGLFEPDEVLDNLKIADDVLQQGVIKLSNYDYNTEVDVNILGHIFEHSLNEIEELQATLENASLDKTKTRRKKEGVFYTPRYITKYIVENTVGALCTEKKKELQLVEEDYAPNKRKRDKKALVQKLDEYRAWMLQLTICDPACGSGAFLNAALEFLISEHSYVDELTNKLMGSGTLEFRWTPNDILEHNLFGVDINEEAVEIARLSLWLRTAQKGRKLSNLSNNIKCGNSLIDDKPIAGTKAFEWNKEFKDVFVNGGFDVIIGNPPYVDVKNLPDHIKSFLFSTYKTAENRINLYSIFIEKGMEILKEFGMMSFINPNSMLMNSSYLKLRQLIFDSLRQIIKLPDDVFQDAKVETIIFILKKNAGNKVVKVLPFKKDEKITSIEVERLIEFNKKHWQNDNNISFNFYSTNTESTILSKIEKDSISLIDLCDFSLGLTPYDKYKGHTKEQIANRTFHSKTKIDSSYKPLITGENIVRYYTLPEVEEYIKYGNWLSRPREERFFIEERIIVRQIVSGNPPRIYASYTKEPYYFTHHGFAILPRDKKLDVKYLLAIVNSKLLNFYHAYKFLDIEKRLFQKVLIENFKQLPIRISTHINGLSEKADFVISQHQQLHSIKRSFLKFLIAKFEGLSISNKISDWFQLSFKEFIKELDKQKIKLSLSEQNEWLQYFESEKAKAVQVQTLIQQTDKEIDALVYQLYGLSEAEIAVVENA